MMDIFTGLVAITCMIALGCIVHLQDQLNMINNRLDNMKIMVNAYAERTERILDLAQNYIKTEE